MAERVAVVGAGVVGCAITLELARRGHEVELVEAEGIAAGVTGGSLAALTHRLGSDEEDLAFTHEAAERWTSLARELREELGIDVEHEICGKLSLIEAEAGENAEEAIRSVRALIEADHAARYGFELLSPARAREVVPGLDGPRIAGAVWCALDAKINALLACRALAHGAAARGASIHLGERVREIGRRAGHWRLETAQRALEADAVVVACGPWTGELLADIEPAINERLRPKRAQCCVTGALPPTIGPVIASTSVGIVTGYTQLHQTRHGQVMFNAVTETEDPRLAPGRLDDSVDHDFVLASARRLVELFPALRSARLLRAWAACEAWTPDEHFLIGQVGAHEGLLVAAGDSGLGFLPAPMVARVIAALIEGEDCGYDLDRYAPARELAGLAA